MRAVELLVVNPLARVEEREGAFRVVSDGTAPGRSDPDGIVVEVATDDRGATRIRAYRGIATSDELFYVVGSDGTLLLTDHFRVGLARVPVRDRRVGDAAIADHLLFRTTPGHGTYVEGIRRLGHGEELRWRRGGELTTRQMERLRADEVPEPDEQLAGIDRALKLQLEQLGGAADLVNMLSGGIDSTLVHTYLGRDTPSVSTRIDSPEFSFEADYAAGASRLLGTDHQFVELAEAQYLEHLERCIDNLGLPPHHLQSVLLDRAFQTDHRAFVTAQLADALFGLESSLLAVRAWRWRAVLGSPRTVALLSRMGHAIRFRARRRADALGRLGREPGDPEGFAMRFAVYSDVEAVRQHLGARLVDERLTARREYVLDRVEVAWQPADTLTRHLNLGHWIDFFCDDTVSLWRQLATGRGKALHAPFATRALALSALAIPADQRYLRHGRVKHLLKQLLARRLPGYPVHQQKGGSGLPLGRYVRTGALREAFERYPAPDFVDGQSLEEVADRDSQLAWNAIAYAVWSDRVLRHADLPLPPSIRQWCWPADLAADAPGR